MKLFDSSCWIISFLFVVLSLIQITAVSAQQSEAPPLMIGYTEYCSDLTNGRPACVMSRRACVVRADGTDRRELAPQLTTQPNHWSEVVGWSPDGSQVIVQTGWLSDEYAEWERTHNQFRFGEGRIIDSCLVDIATGQVRNLTTVERVCNYNGSLFFWPKDPTKLGFVAVFGPGVEKIYTMNLDGTNKQDTGRDAYGFTTSPDGMHIAYPKGKVCIAKADGSNEIQVETGKPFNHLPLWSPDGQWVEFVAGEVHNSHPYIVRSDGTGLRKVGDRNGYEGWASDFDPPDYRESSGDYPCWSQDSKWIYYATRVGEAVELLRVSLDGVTEQLTHSPAGTLNYGPAASPDGKWIAFGSTRDGVRQLYSAKPDGSDMRQLTHVKPGQAAKFHYWQNVINATTQPPAKTIPTPPTTAAVIPQPASITFGDGQFILQPETTIYVEAGKAEVEKIGRFLSDRLSPPTGLAMTVHASEAAGPLSGSFLLTTRDADPQLGEEGYQLTVTSQGVILRAVQPAGLFRGVQTIRQLLPPEIESRTKVPGQTWSIPYLEIRDMPRFAWRGSTLDSCRHFMTKDFVKRYIDLLAYHKMNRLHWHLTEDQSWAIEIKKYPKLTEIGAYRSSGKNRHGGYYTQDDIREIVAYAADRYIMIVPEIEMPGHCQAALACYPELSCTGGPFSVGTLLGVYKDVYCAGNEKTFEFLENVLTEVAALFPSSYIHVGGDECPKDRWKACPRCQARMKQEGLKNENELQGYFVKRIEKFLTTKGKNLIGWEEILEGGLSPKSAVQAWHDVKDAMVAVDAGHDIVMSPPSHCYIDYPNHQTSLEKIYSFEPAPAQLTAEQARHILGAEANLWTDRCSQEMTDSFAYPRICGLAEVLWTPADQRNWNDFSARMTAHYQRLVQLGVHYYKPIPLFALKEWEHGELSDQFKTIRLDITQNLEKLGGVNTLYVIGWFTDGDHAVTIEGVTLIADGVAVCRDQQAATIGWPNPLAAYKLVMPKNKPQRCELEIILHGEGGGQSWGKLWLSTVPNPPDIF